MSATWECDESALVHPVDQTNQYKSNYITSVRDDVKPIRDDVAQITGASDTFWHELDKANHEEDRFRQYYPSLLRDKKDVKESKMNNVEVSDSAILINGKLATYTQLEDAYRKLHETVTFLTDENTQLKEYEKALKVTMDKMRDEIAHLKGKMTLNGINVELTPQDIRFMWNKLVEIKDLMEYLQNR